MERLRAYKIEGDVSELENIIIRKHHQLECSDIHLIKGYALRVD
jgi:hypothetical protein